MPILWGEPPQQYSRRWSVVVSILALLAVLAAVGCTINPATGNNQFMLVSPDPGIAMGRRASTATLAPINQAAVDTPLEACRLVKWVAGPAR